MRSHLAVVCSLLWGLLLTQAQNCNPANSQLDPLTHAFTSDCNLTAWCSPLPAIPPIPLPSNPPPSPSPVSNMKQKVLAATSGAGPVAVCVPRGCRVDEFPFGYPDNSTLPPLCPEDQFCPDQGDNCQNLVGYGGACELNRDDECQPPVAEMQQAISNPSNFNGAICLNLKCTYANSTAGLPCEVDNTVYTGYAVGGDTYTDIVTRDNCITSYYCDPVALLCTQTLAVGTACSTDRECATSNCSPANNLCIPPPEMPTDPPKWAYVLVALALAAATGGTVCGLFLLDRKQKARRQRERAEAWREQRELRNAMLGLSRVLGGNGEELKRKWSERSAGEEMVRKGSGDS